ncbi:hypothetical protein PMI09_04707 [Rhizobium sp. CF122]|nr:hypothetical protein PMI09_04707 [Rhizobium sp. CF122]
MSPEQERGSGQRHAAAASWMLSAIQERIGERDLLGWKKLAAVVDKAAQLLKAPSKHVH